MRGIYREYIKNSIKPIVKTRKEQIIIAEIGFDEISTATSFVEYVYDKYGFSRSCIWYNLKKLKKRGVVDFAEKCESEANKPLYLTKEGVGTLRSVLVQNAASVRVAPKPTSGFGAISPY
ncbi:MAG: hypothetical protein KGH61_01740 [Candidatus Micrarchaeota archaeon]|nr:hypothetical protein [Candidatus Micrarchaeota archaeon]MDE1847652.1 hypothetical protein [Candidatus Micrarchaeota archaeon]MDE1864473.1 hypothetical protein [Candidatus Micrarchaeota archaeon]